MVYHLHRCIHRPLYIYEDAKHPSDVIKLKKINQLFIRFVLLHYAYMLITNKGPVLLVLTTMPTAIKIKLKLENVFLNRQQLIGCISAF